MKKKVLIRAYVAGNLGDDLFVRLLCARYPQTEFSIIGESCYREYLSDIPNLTYICGDSFRYKVWNGFYMKLPKNKRKENNRNVFLYNQFAKKYDVNVYITGSYFIEGRHWQGLNDEPWYESHPYILGCNFGPYTSERYYETHRQVFKKAAQVSFREEYSYGLFSKLSNVEYHPDIVFNLEVPMLKTKDYYVFTVVDVRKDANISKDTDVLGYVNKMSQLAEDIEKAGDKVLFLSFCDGQGDMEIIRQIAKNLTNYEVLSYSHLKMTKTLKLLAECKGVVATRFHAMIFGFLFEKPVFPVCYNQKMENVLHDLEYGGKIQRITDIDSLQYTQVQECFGSVSKEKLQETKKNAAGHFHLLDKELL